MGFGGVRMALARVRSAVGKGRAAKTKYSCCQMEGKTQRIAVRARLLPGDLYFNGSLCSLRSCRSSRLFDDFSAASEQPGKWLRPALQGR